MRQRRAVLQTRRRREFESRIPCLVFLTSRTALHARASPIEDGAARLDIPAASDAAVVSSCQGSAPAARHSPRDAAERDCRRHLAAGGLGVAGAGAPAGSEAASPRAA